MAVYFSKKHLSILSVISIVFFQPVAQCASDTLENTGDVLQVVNPAVAGLVSTQEKGLGHFAIVYGQVMAITYATREIGKQTKWKASRRPKRHGGKGGSYNGMPSGHTASAWSSAAYARTFYKEHKWVAIPLYASAAVTGYSRIQAKRHTVAQVVVAAFLSEGVVFLNDYIGWSDKYCGFDIQVGNKDCFLNFEIKI